jgi:putative transposase
MLQVSTVRSCALAQFTRAAWYRKSTARDQRALALRIRDIAHARPRFGYQRITVMLRREGWAVNRKRVRRLYRERKRRKRNPAFYVFPTPERPKS